MKLRIIAFAAILSAVFSLAAQNSERINVDLNKIEFDITMSPDNYRSLLDRFVAGDTLMSLPEIATVYYGNAFTFDYDPDIEYPEIQQKLDARDYPQALALAKEALAADPLSLELTVNAIIAAAKGKNPADAPVVENLQNRFDMLVTLILSSGRGIVPEEPFFVTRTSDILTLLKSVLGVSEIIGNAMIGEIDAYKMKFDGSDREHILYFNNTVNHRFDRMKGL